MGYQHIKGVIVIDLVCNYSVVLASEKRVNWGLVGHDLAVQNNKVSNNSINHIAESPLAR